VTYQLLAGRLPYEAGSLTELALLQQREYPIRLDEITPEVPAALALAIERALALEPGERYASAEEMRRALHDGARGIAPPGADPTAATSMLPRREEPTAATHMAPASPPTPAPPPASPRRLEPQPPPGGMPPARYEPIPDIPPSRRDLEPPRGGGGLTRLVAVLAVAAVLALVIAYAVGSSSGSSDVNLSPIDGDDTGEVVDQLNSLIEDNTR
jgi:eukaryotic-like serine/threonine-protein kinase